MSITAARLVPSAYVKKTESREWTTHDILSKRDIYLDTSKQMILDLSEEHPRFPPDIEISRS